MHEEEEYVLQMIRAGAAGYLLKACRDERIARRGAHARRRRRAFRSVRGEGAGGAGAESATATIDDPYGALSPREREVLHLVVEGLTTKEIAQRLTITVKTAENHRCRVLDKLGVRNSAELVRYAMRRRLVE